MSEIDRRSLLNASILLIATYIIFFLTNGLAMVIEYSLWTGLIVSSLLSIGAFCISVLAWTKDIWETPPVFAAGISYFLILFTIYIFLIPEAGGVPALIPLFYN